MLQFGENYLSDHEIIINNIIYYNNFQLLSPTSMISFLFMPE